MTKLPWETAGARLHLPRDLQAAYVVGRMGVVTSLDVWPLFWGTRDAARFGLGRLVKLGVVRTFDRRDPSHPAWYALTVGGAEWVAGEMDLGDGELRVVHGIARMNLEAVRVRNRFWTSLVLSCRAVTECRLLLFRPEWELRRLKTDDVAVVPDAQVVLGLEQNGVLVEHVWMVEFDAGTERLAVWEAKAKNYAGAMRRGTLYGAARWRVLALVPSPRRARTVARTAAEAGGGEIIFVAVADALEGGRALSGALWMASRLAKDASAAPTWSLVGAEASPISDADQGARSAAGRSSGPNTGGVS